MKWSIFTTDINSPMLLSNGYNSIPAPPSTHPTHTHLPSRRILRRQQLSEVIAKVEDAAAPTRDTDDPSSSRVILPAGSSPNIVLGRAHVIEAYFSYFSSTRA